MDKPLLYIETSIVSYLAARPSRDPITLRNQQLTHEWWNTRRERYELFTSKLAISEASEGDPSVARKRLALLHRIPLLAWDDEVERLGEALCSQVPLPPQAQADALHIAISAMRGMHFVVTWNCKHIANPRLWKRMDWVCADWSVTLPVLCTPRELIGG
jgi:hypothetical protein